ncbi:MAG: TOBE domain-containing protein [Deltaproteobacteria bacterium]|nr:TOBE domain-containing protein [Deltaproteobacteria bacterium]
MEKTAIEATVNVIEPLGREISLELSTGRHSLTALLGTDTKAAVHEKINLVFNMEKSHVFDRETGKAIV